MLYPIFLSWNGGVVCDTSPPPSFGIAELSYQILFRKMGDLYDSLLWFSCVLSVSSLRI